MQKNAEVQPKVPLFRFIAYLWLLALAAGLPFQVLKAQENISGKLNLSQIELGLSKHYGGVEKLETYRSLLLTGTLEQQGNTYQVTVYRKFPNLMRMHLKAEGYHNAVIAFDGNRAWCQPSPDEPAMYLSPDEGMDWIKIDALFENPILKNRLKQPQIKASLEGFQRDLGDNGQYLVNVRYLDGFEQIFHLNAVTLLPDMVMNRMVNGTVLETRYLNYDTQSEYPLPRVVENWLGDKRLSRYEFSDITVNKGLLKGFFEKP